MGRRRGGGKVGRVHERGVGRGGGGGWSRVRPWGGEEGWGG